MRGNIYFIIILLIAFSVKLQARTVVASSYGYNATDATTNLRNAISQVADTLIIDKQSGPWITRQLTFDNKTNYIIIIEPGVVIQAAPGYEFYESVFNFRSNNNVVVLGYGATIQMRKSDYTDSEFRHCIAVSGTNGFQVYGMTLKDSGGDGVLIGPDVFDQVRPATDIVIQDCIIDNNKRQGISITCVINMTVNNCLIKGTTGTDPSAGIDIEPYKRTHVIENVRINNTRFVNNVGYGISIELGEMASLNNSIYIDNVYIENCIRGGIIVRDGYYGRESGVGIKDEFLCNGTIDISNTWVRNTPGPALVILKPADSLITTITNCVFENTNNNTANPMHYQFTDQTAFFNSGLRVGPFLFSSYVYPSPDINDNLVRGIQFGGVAFNNCVVVDDEARSFLTSYGESVAGNGGTYNQPMKNVTGNVLLVNTASSASTDLYNNIPALFQNVTIQKTQLAAYPTSTAEINTFDNQALEVVSGNPADYGFFNFKRTASNNAYPLPVAYTTSGTATSILDYSYIPDFRMIPPNANAATQVILARNDGIVEPVETVVGTLVASPAFYTIGSENAITVNIGPVTPLALRNTIGNVKATMINELTVQVDWDVNEVDNINNYIVERVLENGSIANSIVVLPKNNNQRRNTYAAIDRLPIEGTYTYKLYQKDKDATKQYLGEAVVKTIGAASIHVWPNPSDGKQVWLYSKHIKPNAVVQMFATNGKNITAQIKRMSDGVWQIIPNSVLSEAIYVISIKDGVNSISYPILIKK